MSGRCVACVCAHSQRLRGSWASGKGKEAPELGPGEELAFRVGSGPPGIPESLHSL